MLIKGLKGRKLGLGRVKKPNKKSNDFNMAINVVCL